MNIRWPLPFIILLLSRKRYSFFFRKEYGLPYDYTFLKLTLGWGEGSLTLLGRWTKGRLESYWRGGDTSLSRTGAFRSSRLHPCCGCQLLTNFPLGGGKWFLGSIICSSARLSNFSLWILARDSSSKISVKAIDKLRKYVCPETAFCVKLVESGGQWQREWITHNKKLLNDLK